jgi:hypothetical protein
LAAQKVQRLSFFGGGSRALELCRHCHSGETRSSGHRGSPNCPQKQRIAHVDGEGRPQHSVERRLAAAQKAPIFDVVMDEQCVVEQLERGRETREAPGFDAQRFAGGEADNWPQELSAALRVNPQQLRAGR